MIEQLRINCVKQMQWMLSHRYSYGYWETPSQDRSLDNDEMKSDTKLINDWRESYCFGSMWNYRITKYGQSLSRLWDYKYLNNLYKTRILYLPGVSVVSEGRDGEYWLDEMDYWFDKISNVMNTRYNKNEDINVKINDYLHVHDRAYWNQIREYQYNDGNDRYKLMDIGGLWSNWTFPSTPVCKCVLYVMALNQYVHGRQNWNNSLLQSFEQLKTVKEQLVDPNNAKMIVLLNKMDLFKDFLYLKPLSAMKPFRDYDKRNYDDYDDKMCAKIMQRICAELLMDDDDEVSSDISGIILKYCRLRVEYWLDLVYQDSVKYIKQKVLEIEPDIDIYITKGTDMDEMHKIMSAIHCKLQPKVV